jgi:hypothetical protein
MLAAAGMEKCQGPRYIAQEGAMKVVDTIPMVGLGNVQTVVIHAVASMEE